MSSRRAVRDVNALEITVIANNRAGTADADGSLEDALAHAGLRARLAQVDHGADVGGIARRAARESSVLIASGGDGTVSTVAAVALETGATFGVIPAGTLNHFARDAGIPLERAAAIAAIKAGRTRMLDVGDVNGYLFLNNVSIGMYPRLVWERAMEERRGWRKSSALAIALAKAWRRYRTVEVHLHVDGEDRHRRTPFLVVANGEYGLSGMRLGTRRSLDTGRLSVYVAPADGRFAVLTLPIRAIAGRLKAEPGFEIFPTTEARIDTFRPRISVALDGEVVMLQPPLDIRIRARALRTIVADSG